MHIGRRRRRAWQWPMSGNRTSDLLQLAGVPASNRAAADWLSKAIVGARSFHSIAKERPLAADHNERLADIEATAKKLTKQIERLRRHPVSWRAFWRSTAFGPVHLDRVEVPEVTSALEKIVRATGLVKDPRRGRPGEVGKQHIVNLALGFFVRFSPRRRSGSPTGSFAKFAREFYSAATGVDPEDHGGLDRQIREAARSFTQRQSAQQKSV